MILSNNFSGLRYGEESIVFRMSLIYMRMIKQTNNDIYVSNMIFVIEKKRIKFDSLPRDNKNSSQIYL